LYQSLLLYELPAFHVAGSSIPVLFFFFFQAEDGIRDRNVTGVQTCALPICMMKYKKINKNLVGFMRATEVTVNNIDNSYNQHMHVLVCVESTYFYNTENYVNQKQWIQFWKRAMKLDYDPNVKVQMIR